ncbi:2-keto-4-pentenoate hydratase 2-oxohepta-3-ene-1,7-dioic acid hydratase [Elasticomyces elasticus]|nr:2-keto-4-pentenoate hydratase 2-oxohepta-3-ene-1,7-dioic acid hydratase [Elasticomyces elasticus]KAK4970661.1 hypothetical protein LTR42_007637 [Elasticomyces elasticus]
MASSPQWKSIIRFKDSNGQVLYGEPLGDDLKKATVFEGGDILSLTKSDKVVEVGEVLAPYVPDTILCIGLNYKEHATEGGVREFQQLSSSSPLTPRSSPCRSTR